MNFLKAAQTLAAVAALVNLAKEAKKDGRISPHEWGVIITNGVAPLLALHGVEIPTLPADGVDVSTFSDRVSSAISLMDFLNSPTPTLPDRESREAAN